MEALLRPIKRALISVSDKSGVVEFAKKLADRNVEILSTGGTAKLLAENGVKEGERREHKPHFEPNNGEGNQERSGKHHRNRRNRHHRRDRQEGNNGGNDN